MKSKCIRAAVIVIIGATVGMALAYFLAAPAGAGNLASGALLGGLIGLYLGVSGALQNRDQTTGGQGGMG